MSFSNDEMRVTKRDGKLQEVSFDKILHRVKNLGTEVNLKLNYSSLVMKIVDQLYDKISTKKIDELTAEECASRSTEHINFSILAGRIIVSNHQKNTSRRFCDSMKLLWEFKDIHGNNKPLIEETFYNNCLLYGDELEEMIDYNRDYLIDYFGFKTLERSYLNSINGEIIERIQHLWMRVSLAIHGGNLEKVKESYDYISQKYFTHATPTLYNAGSNHNQLSSCFLLSMESDSITGIYDTLKDCANISKYAGGIGLHIHNIRSTGSHIRGTNGTSNGIVPMLRVFNNTARYVDQGGGKRNGSFAIYLEPWHGDIFEFLDMRKNHGDEELRARDLFYGLWIPDLFMKRVEEDGDWTLMCPDKCPGLSDSYGDDFEKLYVSYEKSNMGNKTIKARELWFNILDSQMETGTPYMLYKDASNKKSNQQNLGVIKSSNLCTEIIEYSDDKETAVCNLASIALSAFVKDKEFDYEELEKVSGIITENLNKIIDQNFYPTDKTKNSNFLHRPIGIGVQGLADAFALMDIPFHSERAKEVNKLIFETIYYGSLKKSNELAIERSSLINSFNATDRYNENGLLCNIHSCEIKNIGKSYQGAYSSFYGSPLSKGILQYDLWGVKASDRYDWEKLKLSIVKYGTRNSLLLAPMPTASTSQILGNNECFEPFTSNIYSRSTMAGEFVIVNKYLQKELIDLNLWNNDLKNNIILNKGSIQQIENIPDDIKEKYKVVWEIPMKHVIDMSADRGAFICQSQSLNLWQEDPNYKSLTSMHFYAWKAGLKTGMYYLRRKAKHQAQQFTIEPSKQQECETCSA
jgi:ribonucleoside-diphosphate reductase alpha subunit